MTFLNPSILFALFAAALPILFHFLNLRKIKRVEFSSVKFIKELQHSKVRRLKFKQWLLLLLRVLIITSVVLAFARPTAKTEFNPSGTAEGSVWFILDNSFSMGRIEEGGSLFNKAKSLISQVTSQTFGNNSSYIITTTSDSIISFNSSSANKDLLINNIELGYKKGELNNSLLKLSDEISTSNTFVNTLFILSDFQSSNYDSSQIKEVLTERIARRLQQVYLVDFSREEIRNLSVSELKLDNQLMRPGDNISLSATVVNHSPYSMDNQTASLFINGNRRSLQSFSLKAEESQALTFTTTLEVGGFVLLQVDLEDDDIEYDNSVYLQRYIPEKIFVNILSNNPANHLFLKAALDNSKNIETKIFSTDKLSAMSTENTVSILFVDNGITVERIKQYLEPSGRLILFPDINITAEKLNYVLNSLQVPGGRIIGETLLEFDKLLFNHPILEGIFTEEKKSIGTAQITKYVKRTPNSAETPIITLSDGSAFLSEAKYDKHSYLLFNAVPNPEWTNFPLKSIFAPLMLKSVFYLADVRPEAHELYAGEPFKIQTGIGGAGVQVVSPDGAEEYIPLDSLRNRESFFYKNTDESGFYKVFRNESLSQVVSLNSDPAESINKYGTVNHLKTELREYAISVQEISDKENITLILEKNEYGIELWKYFILAAIILAFIEMAVARNSKRDLITKD